MAERREEMAADRWFQRGYPKTTLALLPPNAKELERAVLQGVVSPTVGTGNGARDLSTGPTA